MKQKFIEAHMRTAENYAELSSARRLKVGCVIVKNDTIIGIGYNGMPSGWDNNCEDEILDERFYMTLKSKPEVLHAERNALDKITKNGGIGSNNASLFVTHTPCLECAKSIYGAGINSVYYRNQYRSTDGIEFLEKCGIHVEQV